MTIDRGSSCDDRGSRCDDRGSRCDVRGSQCVAVLHNDRFFVHNDVPYSLAYWLFHAITFERKVFSKIHVLKTEKSVYQCCTYLFLSVEPSDVFASMVTDKQTDTQTDTHTQNRLP